MDPIRVPRREPVAAEDSFRRYVIMAVLFVGMLIAIVALLKHEDQLKFAFGGEAPAQGVEPSTADIPTPETGSLRIFWCEGATGSYQQNQPCPEARAPLVPEPATPAVQPDPNQALLDAADARYAREVQGADRAVWRARQQRQSTADTAYACQVLCDQLTRLRAQMRAGYSNFESRGLHDRQNRLFSEMTQQGCRGCS